MENVVIFEVMTYKSREEERAVPLLEIRGGTKAYGSSSTGSFKEATNRWGSRKQRRMELIVEDYIKGR